MLCLQLCVTRFSFFLFVFFAMFCTKRRKKNTHTKKKAVELRKRAMQNKKQKLSITRAHIKKKAKDSSNIYQSLKYFTIFLSKKINKKSEKKNQKKRGKMHKFYLQKKVCVFFYTQLSQLEGQGIFCVG